MTIFTAYLLGESRSIVTTNMVSLAEFIGWGYERLVYHFSRQGKDFYMDNNVIIIKSEDLIRGRPRGGLKNETSE